MNLEELADSSEQPSLQGNWIELKLKYITLDPIRLSMWSIYREILQDTAFTTWYILNTKIWDGKCNYLSEEYGSNLD